MANDDKLSGGKPDPRADFAQSSSNLRSGVNKEMDEARSALNDARDAARQKAGSLADEAKSMASEKTQQAQRSVAGSLQSFGEALRAAGEQLKDKDQAPAAKLLNGAAGGVNALAESVKNKPLQDVIGDVRNFGRNNPTALIAGSVLAGLAIGRFLKSSAPAASSTRSGTNNDYRSAGARDSYGSTGAYGSSDPLHTTTPGASSYKPGSSAMNRGAASDPLGDPFADETLSSFPEGGQTASTGSSASRGAGSTSSSAFGSSTSPSSGQASDKLGTSSLGSSDEKKKDTTDTTRSTYSSTSGLGGDK